MDNATYQEMPCISSHWLKDMLDSPATCYRNHLDPQRPARPPTDSLRLGTLVHCLALTPHQLEHEFIITDYERRSHAGKARYAALTETGLTVIRPAELEKARTIVAALHASSETRKILRHGKKECTIIQPRARGLLPLKARLDIHAESGRKVIELKTIRHLSLVREAMKRYRYPLSAAFYLDIVRGHSVIFIFVQTSEPHEIGIFKLGRKDLEDGRMMWKTALRRFDECWLKNEWPEAEPMTDLDDDPLMMPMPLMTATPNRQRFEIPVGELAL